jgi:hypothetical protein
MKWASLEPISPGGGGLGGLLPCGLFPPGRERVGGPHGGGKEDRLHDHRFRVNARKKGATSLPPPCPLFNKRKRGGTPLTPAIGQTCWALTSPPLAASGRSSEPAFLCSDLKGGSHRP